MHITFGQLPGLVLILFSGVVSAATGEPYSDKRFNELTGIGKNVVLNVHATWCPTCKLQQPALFKQVEAAPYADVQVLAVDRDTQGVLRKRLKVNLPSTLIVFRGAVETARGIGATEPDRIKALLDTALR